MIPESVRLDTTPPHAARDLDRPGEGQGAAARAAAGARRRRGGRPLHRADGQSARKKVLLFKTGPGPVRQVGAPIPLADDATAVALGGPTETGRPVSPGHVPRRDPGARPGGQRRHVAAARPPRAARDHLRPRRCPGAAGSPCATSACSRRAAPVPAGKPVRVRRRRARRALGVHGAPRRRDEVVAPRRAHPRRRLPRHRAGRRVGRLPLRGAHADPPRHRPVRRPGRREAPGARRPADDDVAGPQPGRRRRRRPAEPARPRPAGRAWAACSPATACPPASPSARRRCSPGWTAAGAATTSRPTSRSPAGRGPKLAGPPRRAAAGDTRWLPRGAAAAPAALRPRRRDARLARHRLAAPPGALTPRGRLIDPTPPAAADLFGARLGAAARPPAPVDAHRGRRRIEPVRGTDGQFPGWRRARAAPGDRRPGPAASPRRSPRPGARRSSRRASARASSSAPACPSSRRGSRATRPTPRRR